MASVSRLVARMRRPRQLLRSVLARRAHASMRCSQLSRINSRCFSCSAVQSVVMSAWPCTSRRFKAAATACTTNSGSLSCASSTSQAPSTKSLSSWRATSSARRVLPHPPEPVRVTRRPSRTRSLTPSISPARATYVVAEIGKLVPVIIPNVAAVGSCGCSLRGAGRAPIRTVPRLHLGPWPLAQANTRTRGAPRPGRGQLLVDHYGRAE